MLIMNNESFITHIQVNIFVRVQCLIWVQCPWADLTAQLIGKILHLGIALLAQGWEEMVAFHSKKLAEMRTTLFIAT